VKTRVLKAESTAATLMRKNQAQYGIIPGVTDRAYMTNSCHVPVYYNIRAIDKIKIEAPYHELCNAGAIMYVEMSGDPTKNLPAFEKVVRAMHDYNCTYMAINHQKDTCLNCGYEGIINDECPICGQKDVIKDEQMTMKCCHEGA
jgi:ribonucleoside-triphosphate reductase